MKRVGLLGGTFGYAHSGHFHVSVVAMKKLRLNEIWWLVCAHNPLKNHPPIADRIRYAKDFVGTFPKIKVIPVNEFRTYNLILMLKKKFKENDFVWIMGMDNLIDFHTWDNAHKINLQVAIVIFDRGNLIYKGIKSHFAIRNMSKFSGINFCNRGWFILRTTKNDMSSTAMDHRMV